MIFLWRIRHFAITKKTSKQHGQGNFLENFQKNSHISRKKVMKSPRFLEDWGKFLTFFF